MSVSLENAGYFALCGAKESWRKGVFDQGIPRRAAHVQDLAHSTQSTGPSRTASTHDDQLQMALLNRD